MPKPAQDRMQRGPLAALLILLGLFLGSGNAAAAGAGIAAPAARASLGRQGPALLHSATRYGLDDAAPDTDDAPPLLPTRPAIVTAATAWRPLAAPRPGADIARPLPVAFLYRARAPPAA